MKIGMIHCCEECERSGDRTCIFARPEGAGTRSDIWPIEGIEQCPWPSKIIKKKDKYERAWGVYVEKSGKQYEYEFSFLSGLRFIEALKESGF